MKRKSMRRNKLIKLCNRWEISLQLDEGELSVFVSRSRCEDLEVDSRKKKKEAFRRQKDIKEA